MDGTVAFHWRKIALRPTRRATFICWYIYILIARRRKKKKKKRKKKGKKKKEKKKEEEEEEEEENKKHVYDPKHISRNASCNASKYTHAKRLRNFKKERE